MKKNVLGAQGKLIFNNQDLQSDDLVLEEKKKNLSFISEPEKEEGNGKREV